jgi:hypothetical protein
LLEDRKLIPLLDNDNIIFLRRPGRSLWHTEQATMHPPVSSCLLDGELVLWLGNPGRGLLFTECDVLRILLGLFLLPVVVFFAVVSPDSFPLLFRTAVVYFILADIYLIFGQYVFDAWLRGKTWYAVTNRRILIARSGLFARFVALDRDRLPKLRLSENSGRYGTIRFGDEASTWAPGNRFLYMPPSLDPTPRFIGIANARDVYRLIRAPVSDFAEAPPSQMV